LGGVKPDLLFIAIIYYSYSFGSFYGEVTGFIGGLFHDAVSNAPLGLLTLPKVICGFTVGMFGRGILKSNIFTVVLLLFVASLAKGVITLLLAMIFHEAAISDVTNVLLPEAFYNALVAPLLFFLFDKIYEHEISDERY
jgi:rod shape-determining protein MreD